MGGVSGVVGTRDRFIASALELFRRQGYNGTSLSQVTKAAGSPTGSLYHHFKGGKDDLTSAVLTSAGAVYLELLVTIWDAAPDPVTAVGDVFNGAADVLEGTDFVDPCPIGTVAREIASTNDPLRVVALGTFESWIDAVRTRLVDAGLTEDAAYELAVTLVGGIEGAFVLARTARDADIARATGRRLAAAVATELAKAPVPPA